MLARVARDGRLLLATAAARAFAAGLTSVVLGLFLAERGLPASGVGAVLAVAVGGNAILTVLVGLFADGAGRRRALVALGALGAAGGVLMAAGHSTWVLVAAALLGGYSVSGKDRGALSALEQAMLPQVASASDRTGLFAWYNLVVGVAASLGALASGAVLLARTALGVSTLGSYQLAFLLYAAIALAMAGVYARLSPSVEVAPGTGVRRGVAWPRRSRGTVARLSGLFAMDAFGGGFVVQSFLAYWFAVRFGMQLGALAGLFFAANMLSSLSTLVAAALARRFGLINTMVFTHLPSNFMLMAVPLAPSGWLAAALLLLRESFSQMDVPTRQSYTMAVVPPEERTAAAGATNLVRHAGQAAGPYVAGHLVQAAFMGLPFFLAGGIKAVYDVLLYVQFHAMKPPEEAEKGETAARGR